MAGAVRSTVTVAPATGAVGPGLSPASATEFTVRARTTVPVPQPVTATVQAFPPPVGAPTTHPVAVPVRLKSLAPRPVTGSSKSTLYGSVASAVGVLGLVSVAVGGMASHATVIAA